MFDQKFGVRAGVCDVSETGTMRVKSGLAEMLKGGVIMDVTNADQARIAEDAGACAVMALERVPADIRKEGGVARMADPSKVAEIMAAQATVASVRDARKDWSLGSDDRSEGRAMSKANKKSAHRKDHHHQAAAAPDPSAAPGDEALVHLGVQRRGAVD